MFWQEVDELHKEKVNKEERMRGIEDIKKTTEAKRYVAETMRMVLKRKV